MNADNVAASAGDPQHSTLAYMRAVKRWLLWRPEYDPQRPEKPKKMPYYVNGNARGKTDVQEDWDQLATFDEAWAATLSREGLYLAFALGPDGSGGHWQGIDLDDVPQNQLSDLANTLPGYVEMSPGGNGCHAIGYGIHFPSLGSKDGIGIEAYASGRYFTVTCNPIRDAALTDLAPYVGQHLAPRHQRAHGAAAAGIGSGSVYVDPKTVTELRSALNAIPADDYHQWIKVGRCLYELGAQGRELWLTWSQTSSQWNEPPGPVANAKRWDTFRGSSAPFQTIFKLAQEHNWINPASNAARIEIPVQGGYRFSYAQPGGTILEIEYLDDPWIPRGAVVGAYGRGEAGKSSWTAQKCADVSHKVSTLWISSEERLDHIKQRHLSCKGHRETLAVIEAMPTKFDPRTKKPIATNFNVFEDMEPALVAFQQDLAQRQGRPLGIVVLDAVVALVTWEKGTNANDDGGVKKLIAHLFTLAERYGVTFIILGHLNKSTTRDHIADTVTGAAAWTNSVRLAYMFVKDMESENYEGFVRTVKSNTGTHFGSMYKTVPVYTLRLREDGHPDVLCGVQVIGETVYGELALRELMAGEDDPYLNKREKKREKVQLLVDTVTHGLRNQWRTTRESVEKFIYDNGRHKVSRRHWIDADKILPKHGVQVTVLERGKHGYSWAPAPTAD